MPITDIKVSLNPSDNHIVCYLGNDSFYPQAPLTGLFKEWPDLRYDYLRWSGGRKKDRILSCTRVYQVDMNVWAFGIIAFRGYHVDVKGNTPLREDALVGGLRALSDFATEKDATIHVFTPSTYWKSLSWSAQDCLVYNDRIEALAQDHYVLIHHYTPIL